MAGQNETLTQFHAAVTAGISAILNAAQAPGWQHLWDGINPQDQIVFCTEQQPSSPAPPGQWQPETQITPLWLC